MLIRYLNQIMQSFFENIYPYKTESESTSERPKRPQEESTKNILTREKPRRSTRQRKSVSFGPDFVALLLENDHQTFKAAMYSSESTYWKEAINSEIESILSNHTWKLTDLPPGNKDQSGSLKV